MGYFGLSAKLAYRIQSDIDIGSSVLSREQFCSCAFRDGNNRGMLEFFFNRDGITPFPDRFDPSDQVDLIQPPRLAFQY